MAKDSDHFIFHPDSASTIVGFRALKGRVERLFKGDRLQAVRVEMTDFRLGLGGSGNVAWFSYLLDDFGEWNGQLMGWENCRWTGGLEKREGTWVIVQRRFPPATDRTGGGG